MRVWTCRPQDVIRCCFSGSIDKMLFLMGLSLAWGLPASVGWQVIDLPGIHLPLPLQHWDYRLLYTSGLLRRFWGLKLRPSSPQSFQGKPSMDGTLPPAPALEHLKDLFQTGVGLGSSISSSSHLQPYRALVSSFIRKEIRQGPQGLGEAKENTSGVWHRPQ